MVSVGCPAWRVRGSIALARCRNFSNSRPSLLWSPGELAREEQVDRLAGKIGVLCRDGEGLCIIGARGEVSTARAMRALARASEVGKSPIEFKVRWQEDEGGQRSIRFYAEMPYSWTEFKRRWSRLRKQLKTDLPMLSVTPRTGVHKLATALASQQRQKGAAVIRLNYNNNTVMSIAAKALATLPHLAQSEHLGASLVCIIRWDVLASDAKFAYAHIFANPEDNMDETLVKEEDLSNFDAWAVDIIR